MLVSPGTCPGTGPEPSPSCACMNGGVCETVGISTTCQCPSGYSGTLCEWGPCHPTPCLNGVCTDLTTATGRDPRLKMFHRGKFES